jgi:hypothetical protein
MTKTKPVDIARAHRITAIVGCDLRTTIKALREGTEAIRTNRTRLALEKAIKETR